MMHLMKHHHQYHRQKVRRLNYLLERIKVRGETKRNLSHPLPPKNEEGEDDVEGEEGISIRRLILNTHRK